MALNGFLSSVIALGIVPSLLSVPVHRALQELPQPGPDTQQLETEQDRARRMTVPVQIDGAGPYSFMIDTGAERTVVSSNLAATLGLEQSDQKTLVGVAGRRVVPSVYLNGLSLGAKYFGELETPVLEEGHIGADGILGLDSLQESRVLFDFRNNLLTMESAGSAKTAGFEIVVRAQRRQGHLILTKANIDGVTADVIIDTGAEISIGNLALQRALARRGREQVSTTLYSVTGQSMLANYEIVRDLRIGTMRVTNMPMAFVDSPAFQALHMTDKPALLMGMSTMRYMDRVLIDFDKRRVMFDLPRPEQGPRIGSRLPAPEI